MKFKSCLLTMSVMSLMSLSSWAAEDCVGFNNATVSVQQINGNWTVVDGAHYMFAFGNTPTAQIEANKSLEIIKKYKMSESCFVGRPDPSFQYMLSSGQAPTGNLVAGEDCIGFDPALVEIKQIGTWKMIQGSMWMEDFGNNKQEAQDALEIVKKYQFNQQCFVARPAPHFRYWKRNAQTVTRADLGAYGFLKIGKFQKEVKWNDTIVLTPADATSFSNGIPAFEIYYTDKNYGLAAANNYENQILLDGALVSRQYSRNAASGATQPVHTQAYLKPSAGNHSLVLKVDALNSVAESNEGNNQFQVTVVFRGF